MVINPIRKNPLKKMKIKINNKFYKKEAIEETIEKFKDISSCKFIDDSFELELIPNIGSELDMGKEFCNFVLGITKDNMLF